MSSTVGPITADTDLRDVQEELRAETRAHPAEALVLRRFRRTLRRAVDHLEATRSLGVPHDRVETLTSALFDLARLAAREDDDLLSREELDHLLTRLEAARHVVRDAVDHGSRDPVGTKHQVLEQLQDWLPGVSLDDLADLVGVSARTLQRWQQHGGAAPTTRQAAALRLVAVLRHGWTPSGVVKWFRRPHPHLDELTPLSVLAADGDVDRVLAVATGGRAMRVA